MEKETIPSENIVFAVLNDGTVVSKFTDKDADPNAENFVKLFTGIEDIIKNSNEKMFAMFALSFVIFDSRIKMAMKDRCQEDQSKKQ